ncbi:MAG TPA: bifunctional oligoribonuclease/PAP phosphatase NrnA [Candidatus Moranbacteria bacterium]|nr:bifunctional oligoribonuclease/PAP phosphatase NrnA [Candidatus Moranbacteria bacterium]
MQLAKEFSTLDYIIRRAQRVLLVAHNSPDGDTSGAVLALDAFFSSLGKKATIACNDPLPSFLAPLTERSFLPLTGLDLSSYDAAIACDSVERGFEKILTLLNPDCVTVIVDHHPDITLPADVVIIDPQRSSACEIIYEYLVAKNHPISKEIATFLLIGILSDTGSLQHANTTGRVMEIASDLLKRGAMLSKIVSATFANKKISTLRLWGRAFEKAKINHQNGMIATVITEKDITECGASTEDISYVASALNTVPGTKFALVLSERPDGKIKGSLRSEAYKGVDVSEIAHAFGGGGHKLASGFEVKGRLVETKSGWEIV